MKNAIASNRLRALVAASMFLVLFSGCFVDVNDDNDEEFPPAAPRGLTSISGDGDVTLIWFANTEPDLAGYEIWRSRNADSGYVRIVTLPASATDYVDTDVDNGSSYYYSILAFDHDGNESDFNPEFVEDTPRPEGRSVTLANYLLDPLRSGFTLAQADRGATDWDKDGDGFLDRDVDIFFGFDDEIGVAFMYSDHDDLFMQDRGFYDSMDGVDVAPVQGYTIISTEMLEGHVYVFFTPDGHYAKIRVTRVSQDAITFDWAYQLQRENTDLAPSMTQAPVTRGRQRPR